MGHRALHPVLHYLRRLGGSAPAGEADDGQLLGRFVGQADQAAFTEIVRRHGAMVWGVCARRLGQTPDAEDAFQATFLVLVRKASGLRRPGSLGPWLYGVANRTALKAEGRNARRAARERALPDRPVGEPEPDHLWGDLRPLLDEELSRLPEKYRRPLLLCYLQGLSNEEAARALGCPAGTVFSRLSRGRDLLRRRLARRGVGVSGAALAAGLAGGSATRAAPAALLGATAGLVSAAGTVRLGVPSHIQDLVDGVLRAMSLKKVKLTLAVVLVLGLVGSGAGIVTRYALARGEPQQAAPVPAADKANAKADAAAPAPANPAPPVKREQATRLREWRAWLTSPVDFHGFDDPETKIGEGLDYLMRAYNVGPFELNEKAFQADGVEDVRGLPIGREVPKMHEASLGTILRAFLSRIPAKSGVVYVLRPDTVEITTAAALRKELGVSPQRQLLPLVWDVLENTPINQSLARVAEFSGYPVVIDPRAADKVKTSVSAELNNVPADTAVRLLANMAGLSVVRMDNVFYVTSRENAVTLQAEQDRLNADRPAK
jgi:RNA polymerase sigma factor (sigma-70 family)